jgi:CubicO group peptidase (beta-lactamase class C family)
MSETKKTHAVDAAEVEAIVKRCFSRKGIYSAVLCVENGDGGFSWTGAVGDMQENSQYCIASVTKLYITAVMLRLVGEGRLTLHDAVSAWLPAEIRDGLHVYKGVDYSAALTILHLLSNTSGLPDYFFHKQANGRTAADELLEGRDEAWPLERSIALAKRLRPKFPPGAKRKASYSDTNYQLLGAIIERASGKSIGEVFDEFIFSPLELRHSTVYSDIHDESPAAFYYKTRKLRLPRYMASVTAEGGIVATAEDVMVFLKAFFQGRLFPREKIEELKVWNLILPPPGMFYFGIGLEKLFLPRIFTPFTPIGDVLGFWGQTGAFAFYHEKTDLYFCGTTNQIDGTGHRAATRAMLNIIKSVQ